MRYVFPSSVFVIVVTASTLVVSDYSHPLSPHHPADDKEWIALNNTQQTDNVTQRVIPQRVLLPLPRIAPKESLHLNPSTKKCHHPVLPKGQVRQLEDCETEQYTIFAQSYMPTIVTTSTRLYDRDIKPDDVDDWNNNLKIRGLWPQRSKFRSILPFTKQAMEAINRQSWPFIPKTDVEFEMYAREWNSYGVKTGLTPLDYIHEINHLQHLHQTPHVLQSKIETRISSLELKQAFHPNACLVCKYRKNAKYFIGVDYCHKVNPTTRKVEDVVVPFEKCGVCAPRMQCDRNKIIIPKLQETISNCPSKTCIENEYTIFAQSYLPTYMITGKQTFRKLEPYEVDDWNSHLKIHTLWPKQYKVKPSTLPFNQEAAIAVNENDWPSIRIQSRKSYEYQWDMHGVNTGLNPLEYVQETQRLHKLHPTPDILKGVFRYRQSIPLMTLKRVFGENACLLCRPKDGNELFLAVHFCYKVNSKTRQMEHVVPFIHCEHCSSECSHGNIYFPTIPKR